MLRVESSSLKLNQILEIRYFVETLSFTMQFEYWCLKLKNKVEVQTSSSARFDSFQKLRVCSLSVIIRSRHHKVKGLFSVLSANCNR